MAGDAITKAQKELVVLSKVVAKDDMRQLRSVYRSLERAHALLELEGVTLSPLKELEDVEPRSEAKFLSGVPPPSEQVSNGFTASVSPILIAKCGQCHIEDRKGDFSAASYNALLEGVPETGPVIRAGDAEGSRLIEVIDSGDMPRGGLRITATERATLAAWINAGAKYDGDNPSTRLLTTETRNATPRASTLEMAKPTAPPTGQETVSFSRDIAPILTSQCIGCHGGNQPRNGLSFASFNMLLKGGDRGATINRGSPERSLLLTKILGTGPGERMPLNRPALEDAAVARIRRWLLEKSTFDGRDPSLDLETITSIRYAVDASDAELSAERYRRAQHNWKLALSNTTPNSATTRNFLILGERSEAELLKVAQLAEKQTGTILRLLRTKARESLIKGKMTVFVFDRRYDYDEFARMVERRRLPRAPSPGHWKYDLIDAYGVLAAPHGVEFPEPHLAALIAAVHVANFSHDTPQWLAGGIGRVVATEMFPRAAVVSSWSRNVDARRFTAQDLLVAKAPLEIAEPIWFAFCKELMRSGRIAKLRGNLAKTDSFDAGWIQTFGSTPAELLDQYLLR